MPDADEPGDGGEAQGPDEPATDADRPEAFFERCGFGTATTAIREQLDGYRSRGAEDSLLCKAMQEAMDNGVVKWAYVKGVLDRCVSAGVLDAQAFASAKRPGAGKTRTVDRPTPSGNDFLRHGQHRPLRIKREDADG